MLITCLGKLLNAPSRFKSTYLIVPKLSMFFYKIPYLWCSPAVKQRRLHGQKEGEGSRTLRLLNFFLGSI